MAPKEVGEPPGNGVFDVVVPNATVVPPLVELLTVEEGFRETEGVPINPDKGVISKLSASLVAKLMIPGSRGPKAGS